MPVFHSLKPDTKKRFPRLPEGFCISLIGMAGAGKSTVGRVLARRLKWAFADGDHLIEAAYGTSLQAVTEAVDKETFLDIEAEVLCSLRLNRCVLAPGGSAVYREAAMRRLASLGPIVYLYAPLCVVEERIARHPDRGLAMGPGQSVADLYREREALYRRWAVFSVDSATLSPARCAAAIVTWLKSL